MDVLSVNENLEGAFLTVTHDGHRLHLQFKSHCVKVESQMQNSDVSNNEAQWIGGGLFGCTRDCNGSLLTTFLPCFIYAKNGEFLYGEHRSAFWGDCLVYILAWKLTYCGSLLGISRRRELRRKYNLPEAPCNDVLVHLCCHFCALCQESREINARKARTAVHQAPVQRAVSTLHDHVE